MLYLCLVPAVDAVFMGSIAGLSGKFPPSYISAYAIGQALSGLIAAVSRVITLVIGASDEGSAFVYFLFADVVLLFGGAVYVCASRHDFFLHYQYLGLFDDSGDDAVALKSMRGLMAQKDVLGKVVSEQKPVFHFRVSMHECCRTTFWLYQCPVKYG
jgi:hypothetical protein